MHPVHSIALASALVLAPLPCPAAGAEEPDTGANSVVTKSIDGVEKVRLLPPTPNNPRNSEGDFVELADGRVLFVYTHFTSGSGDHATAHLAARVSRDGGKTWSREDEEIVANEAGMNVMSVSLLRLQSDEIALFYLAKNSLTDCRPRMRISRDEGHTWGPPVECIDRVGYYVMNNDRAVQLQSGRIVLPVALHNTPEQDRFDSRAVISCYYSDDGGRSWQPSQTAQRGDSLMLQEPGLVELNDGRVMMYCRTPHGSQYVAYSSDEGHTWSEFTASNIISPLSPATIERIPATGDLLLVWNNHEQITPELRGRRTPFHVAISRDEGRSWGNIQTLEDDPNGWYCYTAVEVVGQHVLLGHCAGDRRRLGLETTQITRFPIHWLYPRPAGSSGGASLGRPRRGRVRVNDHALVDDDGPFLGLGVSYFTALWRCKNDRRRLQSDLEFLSQQGFNYYRMLSMVGYYSAWDGLEIAPVPFTNGEGKHVEAWPDYWKQLGELVDIAYDRYGMRTQITVFADAQLMPQKEDRVLHMQRLLQEVLPGREHKIIMLEIANEAWQNGFPGDQGVRDLREFTAYLNERTEIPVATTSNHDWPTLGGSEGFDQIYADSPADLATWHFSRDRRTDAGWKPVYDCWEFGNRDGFPPVSSNEPVGPGASVDTETEPTRLVMAAAFAYAAKLPMYVFHSEAGVFGKSRFEDTPAIDRFAPVLRLLPNDLPNWERNDGIEQEAPLTVFAGGQSNRYWPDVDSADDGCVRNTGSRKGDDFVCAPIGIRPGGLQVEARRALRFTAHDPLTGAPIVSATMQPGENLRLPAGPGALIILGRLLPSDSDE